MITFFIGNIDILSNLLFIAQELQKKLAGGLISFDFFFPLLSSEKRNLGFIIQKLILHLGGYLERGPDIDLTPTTQGF